MVATSQQGEIMIIDTKTGKQVYLNTFLGEKDEYEGNIIYWVRGLKKYGDGNIFMTTHQDNVARSWEFDPSSWGINLLNSYVGHSNTVRNIQFSPKEKRMITTCEDQSARVWDIKTNKGEYLLAGHTDFCSAAAFVDEKTVITVSWDQTIKFWNLPK